MCGARPGEAHLQFDKMAKGHKRLLIGAPRGVMAETITAVPLAVLLVPGRAVWRQEGLGVVRGRRSTNCKDKKAQWPYPGSVCRMYSAQWWEHQLQARIF